MERFVQEGEPRITEAFTRQSDAHAARQTRARQNMDEQNSVIDELREVAVERAELELLEQSGVPAVERDPPCQCALPRQICYRG
jgi:hypothetical protein